MKTFLRNNALSLVFLILFIFSLAAQMYFGFTEHNEELKNDRAPEISFSQYLSSGHFLQSTFENWESEFLQMGLFIVLSISLRQKGSSESKPVNGKSEVDREPSPRSNNTPWPVTKGGFVLFIYKHSLSLAFFVLFAISFVFHFYGSLRDENEELLRTHKSEISAASYLTNPRFWFESFQNWQSEFLSVFAIVFLTIFLREKGSPQSKPVDMPHNEMEE